jgi:hypothetical protein
MYHYCYPLDSPGSELVCHSGDSIDYPGADLGMPALMDREIICSGRQESRSRIQGAVVQDVVDGDRQESSEAIQKCVSLAKR